MAGANSGGRSWERRRNKERRDVRKRISRNSLFLSSQRRSSQYFGALRVARTLNPFETRTDVSNLHARSTQYTVFSLLPLAPSFSAFLLAYVFVLLVWPSERRVKRDVTSRYREEQATPGETAARRFLTRPKATARQLNLIPVRLGWLPRGARDEGEETRERSQSTHMRTFRHNRGARSDDASGKIDRQVEQMQSGYRLDDMKIAVEIAWERIQLNDLSIIFRNRMYSIVGTCTLIINKYRVK